MSLSLWLPILCSGCGATVGAAPPNAGPAIACCAGCAYFLVARPTVHKAPAPDVLDELYLPVKRAGGMR